MPAQQRRAGWTSSSIEGAIWQRAGASIRVGEIGGAMSAQLARAMHLPGIDALVIHRRGFQGERPHRSSLPGVLSRRDCDLGPVVYWPDRAQLALKCCN